MLLSRPDVELILQKDSEGNGYSPMRGIDFDVVYVPDTTYSGEVYSTNRSASDNCLEEKEWKNLKRQKK